MKSYFIFFVFFFYSFTQAQGGFELTGQVSQLSNKAVVFLYDQNQLLDSCQVTNKTFVLRGQLPTAPSDVLLRIKDQEVILEAPLFIGNETLTIHASKSDFPYDIQAVGSRYDLDRFHYMQSIKNKPKEALNELTLQFIRTHVHTPFGLKLFDRAKQGFRKVEIEALLKQVDPNAMHTPAIVSIQKHLQTLDLEPGDSFINFQAFEANKNEFELAQAFDGKQLLLVFSSLSCHWCENTLPILEKMHNKLGDRLRIIAFYMDDDAADVAHFDQKATYPWTSVWDPTRVYQAYMQYNIQATPTFYLFTAQGQLLDKIEGFTPTLDALIEAKLKEEQGY